MIFWKGFYAWASTLLAIGVSTAPQLLLKYPSGAPFRSWPAARPPSAKTTFMMLHYSTSYGRLWYVSLFWCFIRRDANPTCARSPPIFNITFLHTEESGTLQFTWKTVYLICVVVITANGKSSHTTLKYFFPFPGCRHKGWLCYCTSMLRADPECQSSDSPAHSKRIQCSMDLTHLNMPSFLNMCLLCIPGNGPLRTGKPKKSRGDQKSHLTPACLNLHNSARIRIPWSRIGAQITK